MNILTLARNLFILGALVLFAIAITEYKGEPYVYLAFSIACNGLLYFGFRKNAIYFDTFIGVFFWLGFWLKLSVRVAFLDSQFHESVGNFDGSGMEFDSALLVVTCAFTGLICFSYVRGKFLFNYQGQVDEISQKGLYAFYRDYRTVVLLGFVVLIAVVAITNVYFGFYQRGSITRTTLPLGLNGVYKWMLLFGLASASALILKFEYFDNKKESYLVALIALLEYFSSNVAMMSRGMILNSSAVIFGFYKSLRLYRIKMKLRYSIVLILVFMGLFGSSVIVVNQVRSSVFYSEERFSHLDSKEETRERRDMAAIHTSLLFLDRWVGIEGVFAVSSYPDKSWDFWQSALSEKYDENKASFYDSNLIDSPYKNSDTSKHHFISLPGLVAFCFYPGSYLFLFMSMFLAGLCAFLIELSVYKLGGRNIILCALIAQVVAFRYASFGYVPAQSYLLFGSIFLNIILIYLADKLLTLWYQRKGELT